MELHPLELGEPSARWDEPAHDDILFQPQEMVNLTRYGRLGEDLCGFLERGGGDETVGDQGSLGNTENMGSAVAGFPPSFKTLSFSSSKTYFST